MVEVELTEEKIEKLKEYLVTHHIPSGLGSKEEACSLAAINLALTGELTDEIPNCMSLVIGRWIISIQDKMPDEMRNSKEWKDLLPLAAGTGRSREREFWALILEHMWIVTLPLLQNLADKNGFGEVWHIMCVEKTAAAATAATCAADTAATRAATAATRAADIAAATAAAAATRAATRAATAATRAADTAADAAVYAAVYTAAATAPAAATWNQINPIGLLAKLVDHE